METEHPAGSQLVKVAIPMADQRYSLHFGGATHFWICEATANSEELEGQLHPAPEHQPGALPRWLAAQNVDAVVVSQMGERAQVLLANAGIAAFVAETEASPQSLARAYLQGRLARVTRENACRGEHHHHEHHEGHGCSH